MKTLQKDCIEKSFCLIIVIFQFKTFSTIKTKSAAVEGWSTHSGEVIGWARSKLIHMNRP